MTPTRPRAVGVEPSLSSGPRPVDLAADTKLQPASWPLDDPLSTSRRYLIDPGLHRRPRADRVARASSATPGPSSSRSARARDCFWSTRPRATASHNFLGIELARKYARMAAERLARKAIHQRQDLARRRPARHGTPRSGGESAGRPRLFSRPVVEKAAQETQGVHRGAGGSDRPRARARRATYASPATSKSTSR